uniref:Uncharacterized protein n=1 Tax=Globodera rostochiensis TaxID=31243 RepID=A0A914I7C5_GLORO
MFKRDIRLAYKLAKRVCTAPEEAGLFRKRLVLRVKRDVMGRPARADTMVSGIVEEDGRLRGEFGLAEPEFIGVHGQMCAIFKLNVRAAMESYIAWLNIAAGQMPISRL